MENDAPRRLAVCPECFRNYVVPLDGIEHEDTTWWLELRCGWCGFHRVLVASDEEAFALCEEVDSGLSRLAKVADRLYHRRREEEIELFATALARDLISSEDFARQPGR